MKRGLVHIDADTLFGEQCPRLTVRNGRATDKKVIPHHRASPQHADNMFVAASFM
ncbi:hypothetical protein [Mesorhizobium sp. KR9-304]|uniref:hypothetical protein n=1 Tax=Mesorhizobium sp. KR9-304 TaxID=3156614 RepID=UPI0032B410FF